MEPKDIKRKLAAIFSADVKDYSRLMGDNEVGTVKTITEYREMITGLIQDYKGKYHHKREKACPVQPDES